VVLCGIGGRALDGGGPGDGGYKGESSDCQTTASELLSKYGDIDVVSLIVGELILI